MTRKILELTAAVRRSMRGIKVVRWPDTASSPLARECRPTSATRTPVAAGRASENTNGLLRQYFPQGTDFFQCSVERLDEVAHLLNNRPEDSRLA